VKQDGMQRQRDLAGKVILVTGATGGIGVETVRALARRDARIIVGARDAERGAAIVASLRADAELLVIDVSSFASVRSAAERFAATHPKLDVLVNNAGVVVAKRTLGVDGHEVTWATNVLGPFLLTQALLPLLRAAPEPRVVNVGSSAQRYGRLVWDDLEFAERRYTGWKAYSQSKLALMLFTRGLLRAPGRDRDRHLARITRALTPPTRTTSAAVGDGRCARGTARRGARSVSHVRLIFRPL
jgi:retinol dehydrogenase-12